MIEHVLVVASSGDVAPIAWFSEQQAGLWGGILGGGLGAILGVLGGGVGGVLIAKGKCKKLVTGFFAVFLLIGLMLLGIGVWALIRDQPRHVWFVLIHPGVLLSSLSGAFLPLISGFYRKAEQRRLDAEQIRRGIATS